MDDEMMSKRVTRSSATAKLAFTDPELKVTTDSAKARARATRNTVPATSKRKTRADDNSRGNSNYIDLNDVREMGIMPKTSRGREKATLNIPQIEIELESKAKSEATLLAATAAKITRGRPRKFVEEAQPVGQSKPTRGRPKKTIAAEEPREELQLEVPKKITRGRPAGISKSGDAEIIATDVSGSFVKKVTRARTTALTKEEVVVQSLVEAVPLPGNKAACALITAATGAATISTRAVKFDEPQERDKENRIPATTTKSNVGEFEASIGLRARPVRKPPVGCRVVRGRPRATSVAKKQPLTPKKATQVATTKDSLSEDELATMEKTPLMPLTKRLLKTPHGTLRSNKKLDFTTSVTANRATIQDFGSVLMGSPARRPPQLPFKDSMKSSPMKGAKMGDSLAESVFKTSAVPAHCTSPFKSSLLQSPAKRPRSPAKLSVYGLPSRDKSLFGVTPKGGTFTISRFAATPRGLTKSGFRTGCPSNPSKDTVDDDSADGINLNLQAVAHFPGRLSSILPRDAHPVMQEDSAESFDESQAGIFDDIVITEELGPPENEIVNNLMTIDEDLRSNTFGAEYRSMTLSHSPPGVNISGTIFGDVKNHLGESGSEDELASESPKCSVHPAELNRSSFSNFVTPVTPTPGVSAHKTPRTTFIPRKPANLFHGEASCQSERTKKQTVILSTDIRPLSDLNSSNTNSTPLSYGEFAKGYVLPLETDQLLGDGSQLEINHSPTKCSFFEDAMSVSGTVVVALPECADGFDAMDFAPAKMDEEDLALAAEADEMSLISIHAENDIKSPANTIASDSISREIKTVSEASQEYGDENAEPPDYSKTLIDPALLAFDAKQELRNIVQLAPGVSTPVKVLGERQRVFHTVSKVPLKPPADDSPLKVAKRCETASRVPSQRHAPLPNSFEVPQLPTFSTPASSSPEYFSNWSTAVTPLRSSRKDVNGQVLKGAVIYVDVHTTEGADASAVFVELLEQMGARCVKSWNWNPRNSNNRDNDHARLESDAESSPAKSKIAVSHVVFKDGGKRTLEKVRDSKGVVFCVGVTWVLDCERAQAWLPESQYTIDTTLIPRCGHRRRKSMEPRSIRNQNETVSLLPSSSGTLRSVSMNQLSSQPKDLVNSPAKEFRSARRKSTLWVHSPSGGNSNTNGHCGGEPDLVGGLILSPAPVTPGMEATGAYSENLLDTMTPGMDDGVTPYFLKKEELVQRTCPQGRIQGGELRAIDSLDHEGRMDMNDLGNNFLMQRLLLARRKSLQWAPKVGSPLAYSDFSR